MIHSFEPFRPDAVAFLMRETGIDFSRTNFANTNTWLCATARDDAGTVRGVCCFEFTTDFEAHFTTAIRDPRCVTRRLLRAMFGAIFMRAVRVTAMCEPHNDRAIREARTMGFSLEGYCRKIIEGSRDAVVMGMLREDCRYLAQPLVRQVGGMGLPSQVSSRDTAQMSEIAAVGRVDFGSEIRRRAMLVLADEPRDQLPLPAIAHHRVALPVPGKRPQQATLAIVCQHGFAKVQQGHAIEGPATQRISVPPPAIPMLPAPSHRLRWLAAVRDFASFRGLLWSWHKKNNINTDDGYQYEVVVS